MDSALLNARILIADDESSCVRILQRLLAGAGFTDLHGTTDPHHALALFGELKPDLVLLDYRMPDLDGLAFMDAVAPRMAEAGHPPVVVLSGDSDEATRIKCLAHGARDFISKPFDAFEVKLRVRSLLELHALYKEARNQQGLLEARVAERTAELRHAQLEILERLARAAEFRDDDTGEHTRRVGDLAAALAERIGVPAADCELIRRAAPLHDVGKISIPDAILLKPGKLTAEEFETIKTHTTAGARLLTGSQFPLLELAEKIALHHHENWDGSGYPARLAGLQIPLGARVTAVADVYDALTHDRPYKKAWSHEAAAREIASLAGSKFDPDVVRAFQSWTTESSVDLRT